MVLHLLHQATYPFRIHRMQRPRNHNAASLSCIIKNISTFWRHIVIRHCFEAPHAPAPVLKSISERCNPLPILPRISNEDIYHEGLSGMLDTDPRLRAVEPRADAPTLSY